MNFFFIIVLGTRPEIIKFFALIKSLKNDKYIKAATLFTNQHKDLGEELKNYFKKCNKIFFDKWKFLWIYDLNLSERLFYIKKINKIHFKNLLWTFDYFSKDWDKMYLNKKTLQVHE